MKVIFVALLVGLMLTGANGAEPFPFLYKGTYYKSPSVVSVKNGIASIRSRDGLKGDVPVAELPADLKAVAEQKIRDEEELQRRLAPKPVDPNPLRTGTVVQVIPDGVLVQTNGQMLLLQGHPEAGNVADGEKIHFRGENAGLYKFQNTSGGGSTIRIIKVTGQE